MGIFLRVLAVLVLVGLLIGGGTALYNAGVAAGLAAQGGSVVAPYVGAPYLGYPYGWHPGFFGGGFFGFLFLLFGIFLIFGLLRAAFWGGRGWHGRGYGYGWKGPMSRDEMIRDWHQRLHDEEASGQSAKAPSGEEPPRA